MAPKIPLNLRLRKKTEKDIAYAQDLVVKELYKFFPDAIIHGGTAIWRCYQGNRFSEDVDVYIARNLDNIKEFFKSLENVGFKINKKRVKENSIYSELDLNGTSARFEATFQVKKPYLKKYETSEGFFINVNTLSPEELVLEKVETYLKRLKIRDLYDIGFLLMHVENIEVVGGALRKLINNYKEPLDEKNLAAIILVGVVPSAEQILVEIKRWVK
ncbi:MAG: nucleotidyl transferase AbiEii/AbiGii toxin family protein [Candidatus Pacearchaeota archaeon]|nr:nucleotidyl transferase AbiEii/AbiGii toxin family protein [Candidatus Pacearchaeota archaeon]